MGVKNTLTRERALAGLGLALFAPWCLAAQLGAAPSQQWTASEGDVRVRCPLTIGGSFEAHTTSLTGTIAREPGAPALAGELRVDLKSLDTGISLRNRHMLDTYLEVQKREDFETAVLSDIEIGSPAQELTDGQRPFTARLRLHGATRAVAGVATLAVRGAGVRVDASFPVRVSDYGIAKPRHLGVGMKDEVVVRVLFLATAVTEDVARQSH